MPDFSTMTPDELVEEAANLRKEFAELPEDTRSQEDNSRLETLFRTVNELDSQLSLALMEERRANGKLAATGGGAGDEGPDRRSMAEMIVNDEMIDYVRGGGSGVIGDGFKQQMKLPEHTSFDSLLTRSMSDFGSSGPPNYDTSQAGLLLPVGQPIAPVPRQARLFLRDLLPKMSTTLAQIPYVQELNPTLYEAATAVKEGNLKPDATMLFQGQVADPTVIAAKLVVSKQLFEDSAAVMQYINQRLPYMVKFAEDAEFLNGSGTYPNILGINNTTGIQSQGAAADDATTFGQAFAKVENHDGTPTGVVLNPTDAWAMFTKRAAGGSGTFDAGTPFSAIPLTVWGVPTYRTRAMPVGEGLVGDFQLGGMIVDREQVNVQTYRERYAEFNQILLICEERVGLMVFRPDLFVNATLPSGG